MHEASVMAGLVDRAGDVVEASGGGRVVAVGVRLGALCHLSPEHLRSQFAVAAMGTDLEGARLAVTVADDPAAADAFDAVLTHVEVG